MVRTLNIPTLKHKNIKNVATFNTPSIYPVYIHEIMYPLSSEGGREATQDGENFSSRQP